MYREICGRGCGCGCSNLTLYRRNWPKTVKRHHNGRGGNSKKWSQPFLSIVS
jgi:hypothetical protein